MESAKLQIFQQIQVVMRHKISLNKVLLVNKTN